MKTFEGKLVSKSIKVGIVAARFNEFIVSKLLSGCEDGLLRHGVKPDYRQIARSRRLMEAQLRAYIGRNTPLEDNGFYANIYPVDAVITASIELLDEPATDQPADHD